MTLTLCKSLVFHWNYVCISYCFWDIQRQRISWAWNQGRGRSSLLKMAPFDRPYTTTFYWSASTNVALSCTVFELYDVEYCCDLEIIIGTVVQTVLTATFNSCGNRKISTPHKINTREPIKKILHSWLRPRWGPQYQICYKFTHWGLLGKWVKYNKFIYLFVPLFLRHAHRSDPWMDFYAR